MVLVVIVVVPDAVIVIFIVICSANKDSSRDGSSSSSRRRRRGSSSVVVVVLVVVVGELAGGAHLRTSRWRQRSGRLAKWSCERSQRISTWLLRWHGLRQTDARREAIETRSY